MRKLPSSGKRCTSSPSEVYGDVPSPTVSYSTSLMSPSFETNWGSPLDLLNIIYPVEQSVPTNTTKSLAVRIT